MKFNINYIFFAILAAFLTACATVVPPDGGPKDTTPPVPLSFHPDNKSRNFNSKNIQIKFDEFIQLKDIQSQLVVSPAMASKPEITVKGKKLIITPPDSLEPNTTYTLFFGNAIINYSEGLPIRNFQYVLATGQHLDSLRITGNIKKAFDLKTEEGVLVMLYKTPSDSAPYLQSPYYIAKTINQGEFLLDNLSEGKYQIFALKDLNSNYIYDQPDEEIGFLDSLIIPAPKKPDDDSLNLVTPVHIDLVLFKETEKKQGLLNQKLVTQQQIQFVFRIDASKINFNIINHDIKNWYHPIYSSQKDTVKLWLTQTLPDTIKVEISDNEQVYDTVRVVLRKPEKKQFGRIGRQDDLKNSEDSIPSKPIVRLRISLNANPSLDFFANPELLCTTPLSKIDWSKIQLSKMIDTVAKPIPFSPNIPDSSSFDQLVLVSTLEEAAVYRVFIPDSALFDVFGNTNDSLDLRFTTTKKRSYGSLKLVINSKDSIPLIIQLLNERDVVLQQQLISDSIVEYPFLKPGTYKIKAIADKNLNGKWDTGDYLKRVFPEKVYFLNQLINIRANWDVEQKWIIE